MRTYLQACATNLLVTILLLWPGKSHSQVDLGEAAAIFERSLSCGHGLFSDREEASLIESAIMHFPAIKSNPRIAGTTGRVSSNTVNGYYGGIVFGPIVNDDRQADYYYFTVDGDLNRGWTFYGGQKDSLVIQDHGPAYILLRDDNLEDDFEVTEELAKKVLEEEMRRNSQEAMLNQLHRYEYTFSQLPDRSPLRKQAMEGPKSWSYNLYHVIAYSQEPGEHPSVYDAIYNYALIDDEVRFVGESPGYSLFEQPGVEREKCP